MQLVEANKLDLDTDINQYLSSSSNHRIFHPQYPSYPITLRQLLSHSASIGINEETYLTFMQIGDTALARLSLTDACYTYLDNPSNWLPIPPGTVSLYSNVGNALAGLVVERVAQMPYEHVSIYPAGLLRMSAKSLSLFLRMLIRNGSPLLHSRSIAEMRQIVDGVVPSQNTNFTSTDWSDPLISFGLGLIWEERRDGRRFLGHGGVMPAATHSMLINAQSTIGVIVLTNGDVSVTNEDSIKIMYTLEKIRMLSKMLDVGYFIRVVELGLRHRFSEQKKKNLWVESVTHGYCGLSDVDTNWHMNNARYLREADFSRFTLILNTGLWGTIKARRKKEPQVSLLVSAIQIQYRQSVLRGDRFSFIARLVGWDESAFYISQSMILDKNQETACCLLARIAVTPRTLSPQMLVADLGYGLVESPPLPPEVQNFKDNYRLSVTTVKSKL
ncbi:unnamed protein product [Rotaria sp. Silwood2]|nr:unnamed protein product [Rotaria sp. Silwood2]